MAIKPKNPKDKIIQKAKSSLKDTDDEEEMNTEQLEDIQDMSKRKGMGEFTQEEMEGVKDMDSYRKWRKLRAQPILNEQRKIKASDGSIIDLAWFPAYFDNSIKHLPPQEISAIRKRKEVYTTIHITANKFKLKAYGTNPYKLAKARRNDKAKELGFLKSKKADLLELFGRMFTLEEIHSIVVEEWKFPISYNDLLDFKKNNLQLIVEKQELHKKDYSDLRLVQKRSRLEEYTFLYNKLRDKIKITTNREDIKVMKDILSEVRKEIEGEKLTINGGLDLRIEADINVHLQKEVFKEFSLTQIIIGRVASRMNISSSRIIEGLQTSYYARYNRFLGNEAEDADFEEIEYPSSQGYDFEKIKIAHRDEVVEMGKKKAALKVEEAQVSLKVTQGGLKEALMTKLSEKTGTVKMNKLKIEEAELNRLKTAGLEKKLKLRDK